MLEQGREARDEVAEYISVMAAQLAQLAATHNHVALAHVLEMAWLESELLCGRTVATLSRRHDAG